MYVLDLTEMQLLREACSLLSEIDDLRAALSKVGVTVEGSTGQRRVNPAVGEIRQHRLALARVLKALDLPDTGADAARTDPRVSELARYAANQRWNKEA
ncbi:hypothetical protein [Mumia xiangluensis]|uniref:Terminase small subunit n=1 Tax=Mumia xiangluensis TaxID=1678900 RepID=A0ABW1QSJ6_9ACTN